MEQEGSTEAVAFLRLEEELGGGAHTRLREQPGVCEQLRTPKAVFRKAAGVCLALRGLHEGEAGARKPVILRFAGSGIKRLKG